MPTALARARSLRGAVAIHPVTGSASQDWPAEPAVDRSFDRAPHSRWQRDQGDLVALAPDSQHAVSVHLLEGLDVGTGCLEDAQPEQAKHRHQGEVIDIRGLPARGEHRLQL